MIELPEAKVLSGQLNQSVRGKTVASVTVNQNPHKLAWFWKDPQDYPGIITGRSIGESRPLGGLVEMDLQEYRLALSDGVRVLFHGKLETIPDKHQLLMCFEDGSALSFSVQMYGGICCFKPGEYDNPYYLVALEKPSPYSEEFTEDYFSGLLKADTAKLSLKAFLATEQRIPGFGNGVLQDILWHSRLHPKTKMVNLKDQDLSTLYLNLKRDLTLMADEGGRDSEKDLYGNPGGFKTVMKASNKDKPCPVCGTGIEKTSYMGGSIYTCSSCQKEFAF